MVIHFLFPPCGWLDITCVYYTKFEHTEMDIRSLDSSIAVVEEPKQFKVYFHGIKVSLTYSYPTNHRVHIKMDFHCFDSSTVYIIYQLFNTT